MMEKENLDLVKALHQIWNTADLAWSAGKSRRHPRCGVT